MDSGTDPKALIDEATDWIIQLDCGRADAAAFEAWRSSSPRHAAAFAQAAATWGNTRLIRGLAPEADDVDPAAPAPMEVRPPQAGAARGMSRRAVLGAAVTGTGLVAAGATAMLWGQRAYAETRVGERRTLPLPDGSQMDLNSDTRVSWDMAAARDVWLERGEAAFFVATQPDRPFRLHAARLEAVLARGQYNLRLRETGPELTTLAGNGRVSTRGGGHAQPLVAGTTMALTASGLVPETEAPEALRSITAWRSGEIVFDGMPLELAVAEFNRHLTRKLVIADRSIASLRLGGRYLVGDPSGFLTALDESFGIRAVPQGDRVVLQAPPERRAAADEKSLPPHSGDLR